MVSKNTRYYLDSKLCNLLGLDSSQMFSISEIKNKLNSKHIKTVTQLYGLKSSCGCGNCGVGIEDFIEYVKKNLIVVDNKPQCYYFEFNQKPSAVTELVGFE